MLYAIVIVCSILFCFIIGKTIYRGGIAQLFINPIVLGSLFFLIVHILMPILQWNIKYFRYETSYTEDTYAYSILLVSIGQLILIITLHLHKYAVVQKSTTKVLTERFYTKAFKLNLLIFLIGAFFSYKNLQEIFFYGIENYLPNRISFGIGNQIELLLSTWLYISCIVFFYLYLNIQTLRSIKKWSFIFFLLSLLSTIIYYTVNSNRHSIFILLINLLALYSIFNKRSFQKFNFKQLKVAFKVLIISLCSISLFFFIGNIRETRKIDPTFSPDYSLIEAINGAFGNHENIVWLLDNKYDDQLGSTYAAAILNFIPRSVWEDKPLGAGPRLKNMIYPGSYVLGNNYISSVTTGFYTEFLMNFGITGIFLGPIIIGLILAFFLKKLKVTTNPITNLILIFILITLSTEYYYAEFLGLLARFIFSGIPLFLLYKISKG